MIPLLSIATEVRRKKRQFFKKRDLVGVWTEVELAVEDEHWGFGAVLASERGGFVYLHLVRGGKTFEDVRLGDDSGLTGGVVESWSSFANWKLFAGWNLDDFPFGTAGQCK